MELVTSLKKEKIAYAQWLRRQANRSDLTPLIRDLVDFLLLYDHSQSQASICHPGSSVLRHYKD